MDESSEQNEERPGHRFKLDDFEGPLDLLLFLIKRSEINIYDIPISQITDQYLQFIEYSTRVDLDNITEFYLLASTLLYIKSRMLLPVDLDLDEELGDPRQELIEKLIDYQKYKKLTELMREKEEESEWVVERVQKQRTLDFLEEEDLWQELDVWDLLQTFSQLIGNLTPERVLDLYEEVSISEKTTLIAELVSDRKEFRFTDLIVRPNSVMDVVCAFLAVLEQVKVRSIIILQNRMFGDIRIRAREAEAGGSESGTGRTSASETSAGEGAAP